MKNIDVLNQNKVDIMTKMNQAITSGSEEEFTAAFNEYTELLQEAVMAEAKGLINTADNAVLAGRGARSLTSKETEFYNGLIGAMKSRNPRQALADIDVVLPETVIDAVFEDITESHPLLDAINFQSTGALVEIIVSTLNGRQMAAWGKLTDEIVKELSAGFTTINLAQKKLSAFIPISKPMLDLGPAWIDRYIRAHMSEAIFNGLEQGIIDGSGVDEPVGMRRNPNSALDPDAGYAVLTAQELRKITPATFGAIVSQLSETPTGLQRMVRELLLVVSPKDYFTKILPATTIKREDGTYINNVFPFPTRVVQSVFVPENEAVVGLGKRYFMGLGTGKDGRIEYSDEYRFLEDERVYLTKLYGDGKPLDNKSFIRLDITNLDPNPPGEVVITNVTDARLSSLKLGTLDLVPAFNKSIMYYEVETEDATNTIKAVAKDGDAVIVIKNGTTVVENGAPITWEQGEVNTVSITVTSGGGTETEVYTIAVTHNDEDE